MKKNLGFKFILNIFIFGLFIFFLGCSCVAQNYINNNLSPQRYAEKSKIAQKSFKFILNTTQQIKDKNLREKVLELLKNPLPTFMKNYQTLKQQNDLMEELEKLNLLDKIALKDFLPPLKNFSKSPQSFLSSPGSKYTGHHSYPGGLAVHTAANLKIALSFYKIYKNVYKLNLNKDVLVTAIILHDIMKPFVFQWKEDGSALDENKIAGTGEHHIYAIAELLFRKFPSQIVVTLACAHTNPKDYESAIVNYLKAGAIIAKVDPLKYGLIKIKDGQEVLPYPKDIEYFVSNISDGDWIVTETAAQKMISALQQIAVKIYKFKPDKLNTKTFYQFRNYVFSQFTIMNLYNIYNKKGINGVAKKIESIMFHVD